MSDEMTIAVVEEGTVASPDDVREKEKARRLVAAGYAQVSRKHRHDARLPNGMTGLEALKEVDPDLHYRMMMRLQEEAADHFRRVHAREHGLWLTLTEAEFEAFRQVVSGRIR